MKDIIKNLKLNLTDEQWEELEEQAEANDYTIEGWIAELLMRSLN